MSCGCGNASPTGGDLYEARTSDGVTLEVAPGRTQGTREEAMQAVKTRSNAYLVKA